MLARTIGFGGFKNLTRSMSTAHKTVQSLAVIGSGQMVSNKNRFGIKKLVLIANIHI